MLDAKKFWPLAVYGIMIPLNTDVIIPFGVFVGLPRWFLLFCVPVLATAQLCYSFWFWGWVVHLMADLKKVQQTRRELKQAGLLDRWVIDSVINIYHIVIHPENGTRKKIHRYGVLAVWALGVNPIPGFPTRTPCAAFLGLFRLRREFYHLVVANLVHVFFVIGMAVGIWDYLFG